MGQQTGYGIADFYKTVTDRGLARNNLFRIKSVGDIFGTPGGEGDSDLLIYAQGGNIPSRQISTSKVSFKTFDFVVPMTASYPENSSWAVTFYCDSQYKLRDILETWSRTTFDEHKNLSVRGLVDIEAVLLNNSFTKGERVNIKTPVEIRRYVLKGCFPIMVGSMSFVNSNAGEFATVPLTIAFQYVVSENNLPPNSQ